MTVVMIFAGGILGVNCSHAYPHASSQARELLPRGLKGADLAVYSLFKSLGIDAHVLPVLRQKHDEGVEEEAVRDVLGFLRDCDEFEPTFTQLPQIIPVDKDLGKYWKMLHVSRRLHGTRKIIQCAQERNLEIESRMFQDTKGNYFGTELHPYLVETELFEGDSITAVSHLPDTTRVFFLYQYTTDTNVEQNLTCTVHPRYHMDF
jgi:hypothetical protein